MLLGPDGINQIAYGSYTSDTWGSSCRTIEYTYDDNGSVLTKTTKTTSTGTASEVITYAYNLAGKLESVTTDSDPALSTNVVDITEYTYNDDGIRVRAYSYERPQNGSTQSNKKTVVYLADENNHTGYAQTIEERVYNSDVITGTPALVTTYLIGDDVLAQKATDTGGTSTKWLLYDGHGSTRQLASINGDMSVSVSENYSYDAYGVMLGGNPTPTSPAATNLLYSGEHFDTNLSQYNLRARWYDQNNGRFTQLDPYEGNTSDPQSLHKYLYCHANPVNGIDPSGYEMSLVGLVAVSSIIGALIGGLVGSIDSTLGGGKFWSGFGWGALFGGIAGAGAVFLPMTLLAKALLGGIVVASTAIGAFSSFMNENNLQGFFRILVGLVSIGLLVKAPMGPSRYAAISQQKSLQSIGFSASEAKALTSGKPVATCIDNPGGSPTVVISQFVNGRLRVGILSVRDTSGSGLQAFGAFRTFAFNMAKGLGVNEIDMFGAMVMNSKVESMLIRQGFQPQKWMMTIDELEGLQEYSVYVKTVKVP